MSCLFVRLPSPLRASSPKERPGHGRHGSGGLAADLHGAAWGEAHPGWWESPEGERRGKVQMRRKTYPPQKKFDVLRESP